MDLFIRLGRGRHVNSLRIGCTEYTRTFQKQSPYHEQVTGRQSTRLSLVSISGDNSGSRGAVITLCTPGTICRSIPKRGYINCDDECDTMEERRIYAYRASCASQRTHESLAALRVQLTDRSWATDDVVLAGVESVVFLPRPTCVMVCTIAWLSPQRVLK